MSDDLGETLKQYIINNQIDPLRNDLQGQDVNMRIMNDNDETTLLIYAIEQNRPEIVEMLIGMECDIDAEISLHFTALTSAAIHARADILRLLLAAKGINPDEVNQNAESRAEINRLDAFGFSLLMHAANTRRCTPEIIHLLVSGGCDVNQVSAGGSKTALILAARHDIDGVVQALIDCGANVNGADEEGQTPLMRAAECGNSNAVRVLLQAGSDLHMEDGYKYIALQKAVRYNPNINVIRILLQAGSDVNHRSNGDDTILMHALYAAENTDVEIIRYLLESGADINAVEDLGYTILMCAVMRYPDTNNFVNIDTVRLLLDAGCADTINKRDDNGFSALHWAVLDGNVNAVPVLLGVDGIEVSMRECLQAANSDVADETNPDGLGQSECLKEIAAFVIQRQVRPFLKRVDAARVIQRAWRECYYNPSYLVCRKRLMEEWEAMERDVKRLRKRSKKK